MHADYPQREQHHYVLRAALKTANNYKAQKREAAKFGLCLARDNSMGQYLVGAASLRSAVFIAQKKALKLSISINTQREKTAPAGKTKERICKIAVEKMTMRRRNS